MIPIHSSPGENSVAAIQLPTDGAHLEGFETFRVHGGSAQNAYIAELLGLSLRRLNHQVVPGKARDTCFMAGVPFRCNNSTHYSMMLAESNPYSTLWSKYRPVILHLMSAAVENGPQEYKLFAHEFRAVGQKERAGFSFTLEASNGKALNNIRSSTVAKDLLLVLQQSKRATELMSEATYALSLDKNFIFRVQRAITENTTSEAVVETPVAA